VENYLKSVKERKAELRKAVWRMLEELNIARFPRPVYGRIPNFMGAEEAGLRIVKTDLWMSARVVKVNPDSPQRILRERALAEGKIVIMATPRLMNGFVILDPRSIPSSRIKYASTIRGALAYGRKLKLNEIPAIDLVVTGCVAVDREGRRLGKGGGYSELEYGILRELGVIDEITPIVTNVHDLQIVEGIPMELHDLTVDVISTPSKLIRVKARGWRPKGIYWNMLGDRASLEIVRELMALKNRV